MTKKLIDFNLNNYIHVKLTNSGRNELELQHKELYINFPDHELPYKPPAEDEDGFSRFQGHSLMQSLGHLLIMGRELPFETSIKFEIEDKQHEN